MLTINQSEKEAGMFGVFRKDESGKVEIHTGTYPDCVAFMTVEQAKEDTKGGSK